MKESFLLLALMLSFNTFANLNGTWVFTGVKCNDGEKIDQRLNERIELETKMSLDALKIHDDLMTYYSVHTCSVKVIHYNLTDTIAPKRAVVEVVSKDLLNKNCNHQGDEKPRDLYFNSITADTIEIIDPAVQGMICKDTTLYIYKK